MQDLDSSMRNAMECMVHLSAVCKIQPKILTVVVSWGLLLCKLPPQFPPSWTWWAFAKSSGDRSPRAARICTSLASCAALAKDAALPMALCDAWRVDHSITFAFMNFFPCLPVPQSNSSYVCMMIEQHCILAQTLRMHIRLWFRRFGASWLSDYTKAESCKCNASESESWTAWPTLTFNKWWTPGPSVLIMIQLTCYVSILRRVNDELTRTKEHQWSVQKRGVRTFTRTSKPYASLET